MSPKILTTISLFSPHGFADPLRLTVGNVVPGEPIPVTWKFRRHLDPYDPDWGRTWQGPMTVQYFIDDQMVLERTNIPVIDDSPQAEKIVISDQSLASAVYKFGLRSFELVIIRRDKPTAKPFRWASDFRVTPEPVDASWWEWRVPAFASVPWKEGYVLVADFVNRSRFAAIKHLSVEISEVRSEDDPQIDPCRYLPVQVDTRNDIAANGRTPFNFNFLHDWSWLMSATYIIYGPLNMTFAYAAWYLCTDEFGNVYRGVCSGRLSRHIGVSDKKRLAGAAAFAAAASAAGLLVAAGGAAATVVGLGLAATLAAAAAAAYGVASGAGLIAKDPPAPSTDFAVAAPVEPITMPRAINGGPEWPNRLIPLKELLEAALQILALENAHTVTRSRLMGATLFGDRGAADLQRRRYLEIEREMVATASRLEDLLRDTEAACDNEPAFDRGRAAAWVDSLAAQGLSLPMIKVMGDAGLRPDQINELAALVTHERLLEPVKHTGLLLSPLVRSLQEFVAEVERQREEVLTGETYVDVPSGAGKSAENSPAERPHLRGHCC